MYPPATQREVDWLYDLQHFGIKLGLEQIRALLDLIGHPERRMRTVLIAGTNGKGSVAAMLHSMLEASGLRAGMFTSPHLMRPNERIRISRDDIGDEELGQRLRRMRERIEPAVVDGRMPAHPSFFEVVCATALETFAEHGMDVAVLEVGLGGRLDATNAVDADLSVIVGIDLDHTKTLGATIAEIAAEKGGIIKANKPLVSGVVRQRAIDVLQKIADQRQARWVDALLDIDYRQAHGEEQLTLQSEQTKYEGVSLALGGQHQIHNARVALSALEQLAPSLSLQIDPEAVRRGLANVRWPARLQWLEAGESRPQILLDGAHNPAGAATLAGYLAQLGRARPVTLLGVMRGKLLEEMIATLAPRLGTVVLTRTSVSRAAEPDEIVQIVRRHVERVEIVEDPQQALQRVFELTPPDAYALITGSLYLIGELMGKLEHTQSLPISM